MGYTDTFGERGNVRQEICIAGRNADFPPNNDIFPTKKICRAAFGEVGRVGCGYSCDFFTPDGTVSLPTTR
ncbi:hypothetical protein SJDPG12_01045 [Porphyromonas gingivalis SJD12]|nr:hypothetical protein SJDPG12_01045 [Porphyromonas gingivalis SJD12]